MLESGSTDEKKEEKGRDKHGDKSEAFLIRKEEEDEATCLMEEMRKNVEAAQHQSFEAEQSLRNALQEYVDSYDRDRSRARTRMTKCWQSKQSWVTENLNQSTVRQVGWSEEEKAARLWMQLDGDDA